MDIFFCPSSSPDEQNKNTLCVLRVSVVKNIIVDMYCEEANKLNQFQIFIIRAVIGAVFAVVLTRMFTGKIYIPYIVGLAIIMVGLAYFSEYLRHRKSR